ncbi:prohead protease/major capsid protein fusion protein [Methylobacterium bullatum]|uniref:prohead protease/major capsid protein fusion protein n=1 Tax=Methylobacterium bullatum TaxID=570505 RepID=UPI0035712507
METETSFEPSLTRSSSADPQDPLLVRRAPVRANSFDEATRTVTAVISTGAAVRRRDQRGTFLESLQIQGFIPATLHGVPVLDSHRQNGGRDVIGIITRAWIENGELLASIRLSAADDVASIVQRIAEGTLRGVSVGYRVGTWRDGTDPATGERTRTATAWTVHEVSFVPVPADPGATVRSAMPDIIENTESLPTPVPAPDPRIANRAAIRGIALRAGLPTDWADAQIDADADVNSARAAAFEAMQARNVGPIRTQQNGPSGDDPAVILSRRADAVAARVMGTAPPDHARAFMGDRLTDHARAILALRGFSMVGMDQDTLLRAAMHTTSDFQNLLTGVGARTLLPAYTAAESQLKKLARKSLLTDFRRASRLRLGEVGPLQKVTEAGEIKHTTRGEAVEGLELDTYASMFSLSRKAIINDDLGAFRDWGEAAGRAAAETEALLLVSLLTAANGAGPVMGDGRTLFHASHGNVGAASALDSTTLLIAALDASRLQMRMQKGTDGKTPINAAPKFLVVSAELETLAEQVLTLLAAPDASSVNPFAGRLTLLVDPRLPEGSWYVFADPAVLPVLEIAYLSSAQGVQVSSREGWDVLGVEFRAVLDFGAGALDWRGANRTPKTPGSPL